MKKGNDWCWWYFCWCWYYKKEKIILKAFSNFWQKQQVNWILTVIFYTWLPYLPYAVLGQKRSKVFFFCFSVLFGPPSYTNISETWLLLYKPSLPSFFFCIFFSHEKKNKKSYIFLNAFLFQNFNTFTRKTHTILQC